MNFLLVLATFTVLPLLADASPLSLTPPGVVDASAFEPVLRWSTCRRRRRSTALSLALAAPVDTPSFPAAVAAPSPHRTVSGRRRDAVARSRPTHSPWLSPTASPRRLRDQHTALPLRYATVVTVVSSGFVQHQRFVTVARSFYRSFNAFFVKLDELPQMK